MSTFSKHILDTYRVVWARFRGKTTPSQRAIDSLVEEELKKIDECPITVRCNPNINDHTCQHCGNKRCSTSERKCWRCEKEL